jgi:SpoVK/Ycf46/Vps4 family AAA+-type ATPase
LVFVGRREPPARSIDASYAIEVRKPTAQEQRAAWIEALQAANATDADRSAAVLAGHFNLNLHDIGRTSSLAVHAQSAAPIADRVWDACCNLTRPRLDLLAQRIEPKATWDDLVLPPEALGLLRQVAAQVRGRYQVYEDWGYAKKMTRGMGISALFAGESGTGKTMAAEVLANELHLGLYRIDLSAVVSKFIGETEKNLRKLFDAAEQGGVILFFDEADALFGKRSEVKDSHDRYANIEINYLLQRMEAFSGLAVLATNMKSALDQAFMRRLRFIVNFPFPGAAERIQIWQKALAPGVPRDALDYERLARFNLSGGNIHSIALNAAFAAAYRTDSEKTVTMPLLLSATRSELRKLEKQVNEADFRSVQSTKGAA